MSHTELKVPFGTANHEFLALEASSALVGAAIWGLGMGVHELIIPAAVAPMVAVQRRASAFGLFTAGYGVFWFLGSAVIGIFMIFHFQELLLSASSLSSRPYPHSSGSDIVVVPIRDVAKSQRRSGCIAVIMRESDIVAKLLRTTLEARHAIKGSCR